MGELQATLDFSVELGKFHNVDLFQRGFYQIRAYFKSHPKFPMKVEVSSSKPSNNDLVFAQFTQKEAACSKTFQILYKKEEIQLNDVFLFKIHTLVDSHRIEECIHEIPFHLILELYFSDTDIGPNDPQALQLASSRTLKLHFNSRQGVHHHIPVLFDYFHLSAITTTVHGTLLAIHQPSISFPKAVKSGWFHKISSSSNSSRSTSANLEVVLFGSPTKHLNSTFGTSKYAVPTEKIHQAAQMHKYISAILLAAHEGLFRHYHDMLSCLPRSMRMELEKVDYNDKLNKIFDNVMSFTSYDEVVETVDRDLAKLSAEMCILWNQYLELMGENHYVILNLMEEHHRTRVQRFSEAFFTVDYPREMGMAFHELNAQGHAYIGQAVKSSPYFHLLPPMQIECAEIDGDINTLPIIFEEKYLKSVSYNEVSPVDLDQIVATVKEVKAQTKTKGIELSDSTNKPKLPESTSDPKKLQKTLSDTKSKPKFGSKSFIKNIKPESFRRPSSSRSDTDQVVLLGYRQYGFDGRAMSEAEAASERESARLAFMRTSAESVSLPSLLISDLNVRGQRSSLALPSQDPNLCKRELYHISNSDAELAPKGEGKVEEGQGSEVAKAPVKAKTPQLSHIRQHSVDIGVLRVQNEKLRVQEEIKRETEKQTEKVEKTPEGAESSMEGAMSDRNAENDHSGSEPANQRGMPGSEEDSQNSTAAVSGDSPSQDAAAKPALKSEDVQLTMEAVTVETEGNVADAKDSQVPNEMSGRTSEINVNEGVNSVDTVENDRDNAVSSSDGSDNTQKMTESRETCEDENVKNVNKAEMKPAQDDKTNSSDLENRVFENNSSHSSEAQGCEKMSDDKLQDGVLGGDSCFEEAAVNSEKKQNGITEQKEETSSTESKIDATGEAQAGNSSSMTVCGSDDVAVSPSPDSGDTGIPKTDKEIEEELIKRECIFEPDGTGAELDGQKQSGDAISGNGSVFTPTSSRNYPPLSAYLDSDYSPMDDILIKPSGSVNSPNSMSPTTPRGQCLPFPTFNMTQTAICSPPSLTTQVNSTAAVASTAEQDDKRSNARERLQNLADPKKRFELAKEDLKKRLKYPGELMGDMPMKASIIPYFSVSASDLENDDSDDLHLIICVHGLDGNMADLRLVRTYIELGLPGAKMEFLMSERNQMDTFANFEVMTDRLVGEILYYIDVYSLNPTRISFIGHSLGNIIIRSVLTRPEMKPWLGKLHTFLSLSGPHLGTMYNSSAIVNTGMWFMQKWKKSGSLLQLALKDHSDPRETFIYKLSQKPGMEYFKNVVLIGSLQDRYVPYHSARIEMCKNAMKDTSVYGAIYGEMINNILKPLIKNEDISFIRYDVVHALQNTANSLIGRAAHIAVLDSEIFIEKFMTVCGLNYFK
ncbi:protein FAM135A-like [Ptychodera flava]|uniref:protein FAM135A-like n=1 Tax=Ptychodera flava TaxID=63121 RepID=UPI00396A9174